MNFAAGFEKEAALKHWLTAAAIAASPAKAKADDMLKTVGKAVQKTEVGQTVKKNTKQLLNRARNIRLFGDAAEEVAHASASSGKGVAGLANKKLRPSLNLKDGNRLQLDYGRFKAHAKPGEYGAKLDLPKNTHMKYTERGGEKSFMVGFERSF